MSAPKAKAWLDEPLRCDAVLDGRFRCIKESGHQLVHKDCHEAIIPISFDNYSDSITIKVKIEVVP